MADFYSIEKNNPDLFLSIVEEFHFLFSELGFNLQDSTAKLEQILTEAEFVELTTSLYGLIQKDTERSLESGLKQDSIKEEIELLLPKILSIISDIKIELCEKLFTEGHPEDLDSKISSLIIAIMTGELCVDPNDWFDDGDIIRLDVFIPETAKQLVEWKKQIELEA